MAIKLNNLAAVLDRKVRAIVGNFQENSTFKFGGDLLSFVVDTISSGGKHEESEPVCIQATGIGDKTLGPDHLVEQ